MLNFLVRLMRIRSVLPIALLLIAAQETPPVAITFPEAGEALRGVVTISGNTNITGFQEAGLDFSYASNPTNTWFQIATVTEPVFDSTLTTWDTTSITDGEYILRLRVSLEDGSFQEVVVPVSVVNDVPVPTPTIAVSPTPGPVSQVPTPFLLGASPTPTELPRPTPTALLTNPVSLGGGQIGASLGRGALVMLGLFVLAGIIVRLRRY